MKQELSASDHSKVPSPVLTARTRAARTKESQKTDSVIEVLPAGLKSRPATNTMKGARSSTQLLKNRLPADDFPKEKEYRNSRVGVPFRRLQHRTDSNCKVSQDEANLKAQDLQSRLEESEGLVRSLQSEVSTLREQLEKLHGLNSQLESQNKKLQEDFFAANAKVNTLERQNQESWGKAEIQPSRFGDVQKLIQVKLQQNRVKQVQLTKPSEESARLRPENLAKKTFSPQMTSNGIPAHPPPPPPPPPPRQSVGRANSGDKSSALVELYHSLAKRNGQKQSLSNNAGSAGPLAKNAQNSIVGELQNRSAHLLAIKADVENKGQLIKHLIERVRSASFTDIENVLAFVDWLDGELNTLVDETAVLKHFEWPEKKVDTLREAAFEYRNLKQLETEVSSFKDSSSLTCEATLKKVSHLFDKLERSTNRLTKLRNGASVSYREYKIPTDWMLDSGMVSKMKVASVKLAKVYMRKVSMELKSGRHSERESAQEALLVQGVRFAYRAHQFAGGLDSETMAAFEELKRRMQLAAGSN